LFSFSIINFGSFSNGVTEIVWRRLELRSSEYRLGRREKVIGWTEVREQSLRSRKEIEADIRMGESAGRNAIGFPCRDTRSSTGLAENISGLNDSNLLYFKSRCLIARSPAKAFISISLILLYDSAKVDILV